MTDSNYFFCKKMERQTAKALCVFWQKQAQATEKLSKHQEKCADCEQGRKIAESSKLKAESKET